MIKINLLPAHVLERRRIRSAVALVLVAIIVEAAVLGLVMMKMKGQVTDEEITLAYWQGRAGQVGQVQASTASVSGQAASYGKWKVWYDGINNYHRAWASTLADIAKWIYAKMQVTTLSTSPGAVSIQGAVDSLGDFKTAYLNILRSPLYTNVTFAVTGVQGGWSQPAGGAPEAPGAPVPAAAPAPGAPVVPSGVIMRPSFAPEEEAAPSPVAPPAPPPVAPPALVPLETVAAALPPIGVTFNCTLRPEVGGRLVPPSPPVAAGPTVAGAPAPAAPGVPPPPPSGVIMRPTFAPEEEN